MTATTVSMTEPYLNALDEGDASWFLGAQTWIRANAAQTGGSLGLIEQIIAPGFGSPYHIHACEDESFYVLEGEIRFFSGERSWVLGAGGFAFLPRDIPHGFRVEGDQWARILLLASPGGFEGFVTDLCAPTPPDGPPDMGALMAAAGRYGLTILGPLPE